MFPSRLNRSSRRLPNVETRARRRKRRRVLSRSDVCRVQSETTAASVRSLNGTACSSVAVSTGSSRPFERRQISLAFYIIGYSLKLRATRRKRRAVLSGVRGNLGPFSPPRRRKGATVERSSRSLRSKFILLTLGGNKPLVKTIPIPFERRSSRRRARTANRKRFVALSSPLCVWAGKLLFHDWERRSTRSRAKSSRSKGLGDFSRTKNLGICTNRPIRPRRRSAT